MTTTPKKDPEFKAAKSVEVSAEQPKPQDIDGRTAEEIVAAAEPAPKIEAGIGAAKADQDKIRELTNEAQNNAGGIKSDAPTLEETHKAGLESVVQSHINQNAGFAGAIANQMAGNPSHPGAAKTVADLHPRVRHISEFKDGYTGHPDEVRNIK